MTDRLIIATRESRLALWQSEHVRELLLRQHPQLTVDLLPLVTKGDRILDRPLAAIGGKGLFLKELEQAMVDGRAHLAVHSMKDIPVDMDPQFELPAVLERADSADALVSNHHADLASLPPAAVVGTSSLRRRLQLLAQRPDLQVEDLRGNLDTRLRKLDDGQYDAIILAAAGLRRLGLESRIRARLKAPQWLPAPAQAAIAVQCLAADERVQAYLQPLNHAPTAKQVVLERSLALRLQADCHTPFGAYAEIKPGSARLLGMLAGDDGRLAYDECELASGAEHSEPIDELAQRLRRAVGLAP
ncbi:MAG: hydroxymethylbilane synthase [Wenzhouxiangellaceae bacterium]